MSTEKTRRLIIPPYCPRKNITRLDNNTNSFMPSPSISFNWKAFNHTGQTIYILLQNGLYIEVPANNPYQSFTKGRKLIVQFDGMVPTKTTVAYKTASNGRRLSDTAMRETAKWIYEEHQVKRVLEDKQRLPSHTYRYEIEFSLDELEVERGIYSPELNAVITTDYNVFLAAIHPYSELGLQNSTINRMVQDERAEICAFFINDHDYHFTTRYMRIGRMVIKVPVIRDDTRPEGFYAITPTHYDAESNLVGATTDVLTLEDAFKKYPMYKNLEDAQAGDQLELDRLDREFRNQTIELRLKELEIRRREIEVKSDEIVKRGDELHLRRLEITQKQQLLEEAKQAEIKRMADEERRRTDDDVSKRITNTIAEKRAIRGDILDLVKSVASIMTLGVTIYKMVK